jgi:hypothetical protein
MKRYQFLIYLLDNPLANTASAKAVDDCSLILSRHGYQNINIPLIKDGGNLVLTLIKLSLKLCAAINQVKPGSLLVIQYPQHFANKQMLFVINLLKRLKNCKVIGLVHDVESLRKNDPQLSFAEVNAFGNYDVLIAHNDAMRAWLKSNGLKQPCLTIGLFDYLLPANFINRNPEKGISTDTNTIVFAGNLIRPQFIYKLKEITELKFNLYGPIFNPAAVQANNVFWKGSFTPEEILNRLEGAYGLIWDGDDLHECNGLFGTYLQFNSPHKLSLYITVGLPVIVPANTAAAEFVISNNIGIAIDSLLSLNHRLSMVSVTQYDTFKTNISIIRNKLINGGYLSDAIEQAENEILGIRPDGNKELI